MQLVPSHLSSSFLPPLAQERTRIFCSGREFAYQPSDAVLGFAVSQPVLTIFIVARYKFVQISEAYNLLKSGDSFLPSSSLAVLLFNTQKCYDCCMKQVLESELSPT